MLILFVYHNCARKWVFCPPVLENPKLASLTHWAGGQNHTNHQGKDLGLHTGCQKENWMFGAP